MKQKTFNIKNTASKAAKTGTLLIEGDLGIKNASSILKSLQSAELSTEKLIVSLRNVDKLDITTIQLIRSFENHLKEKGLQLEVNSELSDDIKKLLSNTGFTSTLTNS